MFLDFYVIPILSFSGKDHRDSNLSVSTKFKHILHLCLNYGKKAFEVLKALAQLHGRTLMGTTPVGVLEVMLTWHLGT